MPNPIWPTTTGGFGTGPWDVDPAQLRRQQLSNLLMGLGAGILSGKTLPEGFGRGLLGAQQGVQQAQEDAQKRAYFGLQTKQLADAESQKAAKQKATEDWILTQPVEQQPKLRAAAAAGALDNVIAEQFKPAPEADTPFKAWMADRKAKGLGNPTLAELQDWQQRQRAQTNVTVNNPLESEFAKTLGKEEGTQASTIYSAGQKAAGTLDTVNALRQAREALQAAGSDVSALAPVQAKVSALMQSLNLSPETLGLPADAGPAQVIDAMSSKLALSNIGADQGGLPANNFTEADRDFITRMEARLGDQPTAYDAKLLIRQRVAERNAQAAEKWQNYPQTQEGWHQFQKDWRAYVKANPLFGKDDQVRLFQTSAGSTAAPAAKPTTAAGGDIDAILAKPPASWTEEDRKAVEKYLGQ